LDPDPFFSRKFKSEICSRTLDPTDPDPCLSLIADIVKLHKQNTKNTSKQYNHNKNFLQKAKFVYNEINGTIVAYILIF